MELFGSQQARADNFPLALRVSRWYIGAMSTVRALLDDHEAAVLGRIAELRAELVPLERELLEVRLARAALKGGTGDPEQRSLVFAKTDESGPSSHVNTWRQRLVTAALDAPKSPYARL